MHNDPIVDELHKIREQLLEEHGGLEGYVAHLQKMQEAMKERVVGREPRRPTAKRRIS